MEKSQQKGNNSKEGPTSQLRENQQEKEDQTPIFLHSSSPRYSHEIGHTLQPESPLLRRAIGVPFSKPNDAN